MFAVKGISEENFKPSRVNRCLVFWLLTLEKPHFQPRRAEGPGVGRETHGCEMWADGGTQLTWAQGTTDFQDEGLGESPFTLSRAISVYLPP